MSYDELLFDDAIKEYYEKIIKIKKNIDSIESSMQVGVVLPKQENISTRMNNNLNDRITEIIELVNDIKNNLQKYIEDLDILNNGFVNRNLNLNVEISFFKEAFDIIENEL